MACMSQALVYAAVNTCCSSPSSFQSFQFTKCRRYINPNFRIRASLDESDCNVEECAPDKEISYHCSVLFLQHDFTADYSVGEVNEYIPVGKISVEWLAGEKTKVAGTYPPRKRGWTGYVEKDTAGQTNIYSVEPTVYVAESVISSGNAGSSADGSENTAAIAAGLALIFVAAASSILLQMNETPQQVSTMEYSGPSLSYYINKFKPDETVAAVPSQSQSSMATELANSAPEVSQVTVESGNQLEPSASSINNVS